MRICILGSTGMLGNAVAKHFLNSGHEVVLTHRTEKVKLSKNSVYFDAENTDLSFNQKKNTLFSGTQSTTQKTP